MTIKTWADKTLPAIPAIVLADMGFLGQNEEQMYNPKSECI
jgi:hypothetical protein